MARVPEMRRRAADGLALGHLGIWLWRQRSLVVLLVLPLDAAHTAQTHTTLGCPVPANKAVCQESAPGPSLLGGCPLYVAAISLPTVRG